MLQSGPAGLISTEVSGFDLLNGPFCIAANSKEYWSYNQVIYLCIIAKCESLLLSCSWSAMRFITDYANDYNYDYQLNKKYVKMKKKFILAQN